MNLSKGRKLLLLVILLAGILGLGYWGIQAWLENEKEHAIYKAKQYIKDHYPEMKYRLEKVNVSYGWGDEFKFYGYYAYEVIINDTETEESFGVYYDRGMKKLDDSRNIEEQEEQCSKRQPLIEQYLSKHFGKQQSSEIWYDFETKEPFIHVEIEENIPFMSIREWKDFQRFLKDDLGISKGHVAVYYGYTDWYWEAKL